MRLILFLMTGALSLAAMAGGMNSGGGTGYVMPDGSVHLLDTYEAQHYGLTWDLGTSGAGVEVRLQQILKRLSMVMVARSHDYKNYADTFFNNVEWIEAGEQIDNPSDLEGVIVPAGSQLVQLAFQRSTEEITPGRKRYVIDRAHYNQLSENDQVALIMHEIVYHDLLDYGLASSERARYITEQVLSVNFDWHAYIQLMARHYFGRNEFLGQYDNPNEDTNKSIIEYIPESSQNGPQEFTYNHPRLLWGFYAPEGAVPQLKSLGYINPQINIQSGQVWSEFNSSYDPASHESTGQVYNYQLASYARFSIAMDFQIGRVEASSDSDHLTDFYYSLNLNDVRKENAAANKNVLVDFEFGRLSLQNFDRKEFLNAQRAFPDTYTRFKVRMDQAPDSSTFHGPYFATIEDAKVKLSNGTGFDKGDIEFLVVDATGEWVVNKIRVDKATANLPAPKLGDRFFVKGFGSK